MFAIIIIGTESRETLFESHTQNAEQVLPWSVDEETNSQKDEAFIWNRDASRC